jgi:phytoene dehydrogenase-like protein
MWIDTGAPPDRCSFFLSAAVFYGFPERGGAYPAGGSQAMSASLIPVIEAAGGRVRVWPGVA